MAVHLSSQGVSLVLAYADALAAPLPHAVTVRADASDEGSARSPFDAAARTSWWPTPGC